MRVERVGVAESRRPLAVNSVNGVAVNAGLVVERLKWLLSMPSPTRRASLSAAEPDLAGKITEMLLAIHNLSLLSLALSDLITKAIFILELQALH